MRTSIGLVFSALFVSAVLGATIVPNVPVKLMPGQSYVYTYTGRLVSGISQMNQAAGLEIISDIVLQPEQDGTQIVMQLTNIRVGKHNGVINENNLNGDIVFDHQEYKEYEQELGKPIRFYWTNGQIKSFAADQNEEEWSINIKKNILGLFNINLNPKSIMRDQNTLNKDNLIHQRSVNEKLVNYPIYEDGIGGICETIYNVNQAADKWQLVENNEFVFNVTKTRNYQNCLTHPTIENTNIDIRGAPVACHHGKSYPVVEGYYPVPELMEPVLGGCVQETPEDRFNFVKYNISKIGGFGQIDSIYGEGKTIYNTNGNQIMVIVKQNLTLEHVVPTSRVGQIQPSTNYKVHEELSFRMPRHEDTETLDIPYFHLFGKINEEELQELIPVLLRSIAEDIATGDVSTDKRTMQKVVQLSKAVAVLDRETLEKIFNEIALKGRSDRATEHQRIVRKLFIDLIGAAGTTQSALLAKRLFEKDLVTVLEAKEMFEAIPQNLYIVDVKVIEAYLNLFLTKKVQEQRMIASSVGITLGKMIKEATVKVSHNTGDIHNRETIEKQRRAQYMVNNNQNSLPTTHFNQQLPQQPQMFNSRIRRSAPWEKQFQHDLIEKDQVTKVIEILEKSLKECDTFYQKVTLIETLAHMGVPEVLEVLAPYVNDQATIDELPGYPVEDEKKVYEERNFVRQIVIYALSHISQHYPQQVLALLMPVYENIAEPYEVRIAAFTIILHSQPGKHVLERIASQLNTENNRQVKSFVYSALDTASNFTQPGLKQLAEDARLAIQLAPVEEFGLEYSKMVGHNFYHEEKQFGFNVIGDWVASNVSRIPRAAYFTLRQTNGPFQDVMLELGYNAKGIETLVDRLMEPNGILSDAFEAMTTKPKDRRVMKRSTDTAKQALQALKDKLNLVVRSEEEPKATVFFKTFERTSYLSLDRHYLNQLIDSAEDSIKDLSASLMQGKSYHYVKLIMPSQFVKVVPSELGLPVAIVERHPTILSVKISNAKLAFETAEKGTLPTAVNMTIQMQPLIFHSTFQFVYAVSPVDNMAFGTHVEKATRFTLPVELSFGYKRENNELSWSVVPKVPEEMFHHHTVAKTFISKISIAGTPNRDWLEESVEIKTRPVAYQYEEEYLQDTCGLGFRVQVKTEDVHSTPFYKSETAMKHGYLAALIELLRNDDITPCEVHVQLESDRDEPVSGYDFTLGYKQVKHFDDDETDDSEEKINEKYLTNFEENYELNRNRQQQVYRHTRSIEDTISSEEIFEKIFGKNLEKKAIKKMAVTLMRQTRPVWEAKWDEEKEQTETVLPTYVAHDFVFSAVARSSRPKLYAANVLLVKSFDERNYWLKMNAFAKKQGQETEDRQLCFGAVASYPTIPDEFYYEPTTTQDLKAKLMAKINYGFDCETGAQILINGIMEKTDEKVLKSEEFVQHDGQSPARQQEWFYQQCQVDRAQGKPLSHACELAIIEDSYFKQLVLDIKYRNIAPEFVNITRKLALATKVAYYENMENNDLDVDNEDDLIRITTQFSTRFADIPLANLYIETPKENTYFEKIYLPFLRPTSALVSMRKEYGHLMTGYKNVEKCVVMENFVRTFDNVTVQLENSPCQYLVAKDCSAYEKFAIFARQVDTESKTKTVTVLVSGTEIKMLPPTKPTNAQIVIDGQTVELTTEKPYIAPKNDITIYLQKTLSETTSPIVVVECEKDDLKVVFDGKNVKVLVGNQYQGNTCGLCGDNNQEAEDEFVGPDNCIYQNAKDFVNSYALTGQHCEQIPISKGLKRCPKEIESGKYYTRFANLLKDQKKQYRSYSLETLANKEELAHIRQGQMERQIARQNGQPLTPAQKFTLNGATPQQQQLIQRLRTHAIMHQNQICFSVKPVLACIEGVSRPVQLHSQVIGYHCLPNTSISAQRLAEQSQYQVLELFGRKQVDFTTELQIPVACAAA